ncbi:helix-turn-helix domain-containing protein [Nocardioides iriomotensis]|uniref:GAF domain-containing protein n=1 Tax=Nocardioides iriomotensis TaxID=715784 RepID=A0A4Q5IUA5_9ACTN|nr:GAF domain-containing protein [Nocardioides iriomotensis]RYU09402.1 GAF domain-containing protein [Nocardioides iriomotensis]
MWTAYLELLARDAPAVEYEAPVLDARSAGESAEVIDQLEEGKRLALQVRESLLTQRRREDELSALYDTAYDLARLSDLDSVLEAIVHRARQLLRTDVAYLSMNDADRGDTYMRVTVGCTSARFKQVRLGMGEGLGGLVAESAMPYNTASYFDDPRFNHTSPIDSAVAEEGLVAILGVPLQLGSTVIGVLYAANRNQRPFSRSEVALLQSLAAHAAAAIDKARLLDETRVALDELRSVHLLLQERTRSVERAADAHDRMARAVLHGGGVRQIGAALVDVLGGELLALDEENRLLESVGDPVRPDPEVLEQAVAASLASGRVVAVPGEGTSWSVVAVTVDQEQFGSLVLQRDEPLDDADQRIIERAAVVTALLMLSLRSGIEAENRVRGELVDDLLRAGRPGGQDAETLTERARRLGTDLAQPLSVYVVTLDGADRRRGASAVDHIASLRDGLGGAFEGRLALVLPPAEDGAGPDAVARQLAAELGATLAHPVTVGGAGPVASVPELSGAHDEAVRCVTALVSLGRAGQGASLAELGFVGLVLGDQPDVPGFVTTALGPLLDYDERRGTDLVGTLQAYFDAGGNLARTREALHVHVNTVAQRLDRVGKLIGEDWQEPERQLELQVALRLHRISQ